jgi:predicted RecB family nuclease
LQRHRDGTIVVSATDLVGFLACDHLTTLELGAASGLWDRPHEREDPEVRLLQERGEAHERAFLDRQRAEGRSVVEIARPEPRDPDGYRAAEAATRDAMRAGTDVVYQATLFDGRWLGYADFLIRVGTPSPVLGDWSYEVADTKLARSVKASALLQVCVYSDRLEQLQGVRPRDVHVVTGDGRTNTLRLNDYAAYYRAVRGRFEREVFGADHATPRDPATAGTYPDPVDHCRVCAWFPVCMDRRRADDHLSLVAGMSRAATAELAADGVPTLAALGRLDASRPVPDLNARTLERLREQARLQLAGRELGRPVEDPLWERIPPRTDEPGRGLALLPEPTRADLFFDIEADPWLEEHGREYLLGVLSVERDGTSYRPLWGHGVEEERAAFEAFIDDVVARLERDPRMHVYHYGGYESGAIKRLMQRHATREDEVDRILRGGVLVDLYAVVRQGIRASVESYSLKQVEHLFGFDRQGRVTRAGFSVVEYEDWLRDGDPTHLEALADYNRDDCLATLGLRDWLEARRWDAVLDGWDLPRPKPVDGAPGDELAAQQAETAERVRRLREGLDLDPAVRALDPEAEARWLLASLLDYHRREAKPQWWHWFELRDRRSAEELVGESDAIGELVFETDLGPAARSILQRFRFPPQDHRFDVGDTPIEHGTGRGAGTIVELDDAGGTLVVKRSAGRADERPSGLIPSSPFPTDVLRDGLARFADDVIERGLAVDGRYRAARDLLLRRPPRIGRLHGDGAPLREPAEPVLDAARRVVVDLDRSVLAVQGPPGTGKTYSGARMVLAALAAGRRPIGVTAQSHRTITNFLEALDAAAGEAGISLSVVQKCDTVDHGDRLGSVRVVASNKAVDEALGAGSVDVLAGTSWLFARQAMDGRLALLVVDEASQAALATVLAMSGAAESILLLGDPNQLAQVTQGLHPDGAEASSLEHVIAGSATIPPERGLFLDTTWRMHPAVNEYVSASFYDERLGTHPATARQHVGAAGGGDGLDGAGIRWDPIVHTGDAQRSWPEAVEVATIVERLVGRPWTDFDGRERPLTLDDILIIAPYNAHVAHVQRAIEARFGRGRHDRVGTVDRFQGREGAVAIYTMAASSADDAPRGMDFLYDTHRLNVAVSRARAISIVVASPALLRVRARTPEQMRLANALCRLVEVAAEQAAEPAISPG